MNILMRIKSVLFTGSERSVKAKKNILLMFFLKGGCILIGLLLVPMTINYVDSENYGVWLTLSSMVSWMSFFNLGINNGLKNKLGEALAKGNHDLGKMYVSTTYAILGLIFIPLMILLLFLAPFVNWNLFLNIQMSGSNILASIWVLIIYFCLYSILSTINVVLQADQNPAGASGRDLIQQLLSLLVIWILTLTTQGDLLKLCIALCASPVIVYGIFNITLFKGRYKAIAPSFKSIDFTLAPSLLKLGVKFFIIQIAGIIQFQMSNFIILKYIGATEVTAYNIAYKYISVLWLVWSIMTTPIWAAVTDAVSNGDYAWIRNMQKRYQKLLILFTICGILMVICSPWVYNIWVGDSVSIEPLLSALMFIYIWVMMFGNVYVSILNGAGKLNLQMYACVVSPIVFIAVFFLCHRVFNLGVLSVLIASIVANFNGFIIAPIQCRNYLRGLSH